MLDYHLHTKLCGHAVGEIEAYVAHAVTQPLQEIGFADHLPMLKWAQPTYAMSFEDLPQYVANVRRVQQMYPNLPIKLGIEADYYSAAEEAATRALLEQYPFDYVYGSVHFVDDWAIDDPSNLTRWAEVGVDVVYERYFLGLQAAARSRLFDIMAHTDLVKKFGHTPTRDFSALIDQTLRCYRECGVAVEINTSGLRRPAREIYPAPAILQLLKRYEIPLVFGSDAHQPDEVGKDFALAQGIAKTHGLTHGVIFEQRRIVGTFAL